jgi:hypothetical protein
LGLYVSLFTVPRQLTQRELERKAAEEAQRKRLALIALGLLAVAPRLNSHLTFDSATRRYRAPDGRFVSKQAVRLEAHRVVQTSTRHLVELSERLRAGEISLAEWVVEFRAEIKRAHSLAYILARGGRDAMTGSDWGRLGQLLRFEYDALNRFATQIQNGAAVNMGRVRMYANSIRLSYENTLISLALQVNPELKGRWRRTAQESCPGCIEQEDLGERLLRLIPERGSQHCLSNCRCFVEIVPD